MANNLGTLVTSPIRPASDQDTFPSAFANEIKGGHHTVAAFADLAKIPADRLQNGMSCFVEATGYDFYYIDGEWVDLLGIRLEDIPAPDVSDASQLTTGTVADRLLSANIARLNAATVFNPKVLATDNNQQITAVTINPSFDASGHYNVNTRALVVKGNMGLDQGSLFVNDGSLYTTFVRANGGHLVFGNDNADYGRFFGNGNFRIGGNWVDVGYRFSVLGSALIEGPEGLTIKQSTGDGTFGFRGLNIEGTATGYVGASSGGISFRNLFPSGATPLTFQNDVGVYFQMWGGGSANSYVQNSMLFQYISGNADFRLYEATKAFRIMGGSDAAGDFSYRPDTQTLSINTVSAQRVNAGILYASGYLYANRQFNAGDVTLGPVDTGIKIQIPDHRWNNNLSPAGTVVSTYQPMVGVGIATVASTNAVTYTRIASLGIKGAPVAGLNSTFTSAFALSIESGDTYLGGNIVFGTHNTYSIGTNTVRPAKLWTMEIDASNVFSNLIQINTLRSRGSNLRIANNANATLATLFESGNINIGTNTVDSGNRVLVDGNVSASGYTISPPISLFATSVNTGYTPSVQFDFANASTDQTTVSHENGMVLRMRAAANNGLPKRVGMFMKLSSEASSNESNKMGGMLLESLNTYSNGPTLWFLTFSERRVAILNDGTLRTYGSGHPTDPTVFISLTNNDINFNRTAGASYITQLSNQALVFRVFSGATTVNQFTLHPNGVAAFSGAVQTSVMKSNGTNFLLRNNANTTLLTAFESGNIRIGEGTTDQGHKLQVDGTAFFQGNLSVQGQITAATISATGNMGASGYIRTGGVLAIGVSDYLTIDSSAIAEFRSTTQGILPPRMTAAQMAAIANPKDSLIAFQTDGVKGLYIYIDGSWKRLAIAA